MKTYEMSSVSCDTFFLASFACHHKVCIPPTGNGAKTKTMSPWSILQRPCSSRCDEKDHAEQRAGCCCAPAGTVWGKSEAESVTVGIGRWAWSPRAWWGCLAENWHIESRTAVARATGIHSGAHAAAADATGAALSFSVIQRRLRRQLQQLWI